MQNHLEDISKEMFRKRVLLSLLIPLLFVITLWIIRFVEFEFQFSLVKLGIYPLSLKGIVGVFLSPFIHENSQHLFNNSLPLFVLGSALFYFYSDVAFRVIALSWIMTGILVWLVGRASWHIGASGLVYSLASFLFVSGLIRRYFRLLALSMLVVYMYGSMVWGMFPFVDVHVSWEAHMMGAISGMVLAFWYRNEGPLPPQPIWYDDEDEDEEEDEDDNDQVIDYKNYKIL